MLLNFDAQKCKAELLVFQRAQSYREVRLKLTRHLFINFDLNPHISSDLVMTVLFSKKKTFLDFISFLNQRFVLDFFGCLLFIVLFVSRLFFFSFLAELGSALLLFNSSVFKTFSAFFLLVDFAVVIFNFTQLLFVNLLAVLQSCFVFTIAHVKQIFHNLVRVLTSYEPFFYQFFHGFSFKQLKLWSGRHIPI